MGMKFNSGSLADTEEFLNRNYTTMQIGNATEGPIRSRITRDVVGTVSLDRLDVGFDMRYDADPLGKICLCGVETGSIEENYHDEGVTDVFEPGEVGILTPPELRYSGVVHRARFTITMFDPHELTRVASGENAGAARVSLIGHRPVSAVAGSRLRSAIEHVRQLSDGYDGEVPRLVAATATQYLAATVLETFPNTAAGPTPGEGLDAHPATVRRAVAYMESHILDDIAVGDIAAASYVTARTLQLAFRRHLDTTPMEYLRRMRLHGAHEELLARSVDSGATVGSIAARWGFGHPGRFAARYRLRYGHAPGTTLEN
ncbi:helix-turn-helix transcriptional regulator [Nocardia vaccinii]|uniref:helix-turn-helix transcriptional regulator n=1 Tax=Nocardia vaccinii TaxID=1822 RepID=UPI000832C2FB|nr:helix-turn-helix domain-containing protein [Nocardia vaccinii]